MPLPPMTRISQRFPREALEDIDGTLQAELAASGVAVRPGQRIALAVGSRGIANLAQIVRTTVAWVQNCGGKPFIIPAMGSHGGATAEGQAAVLAGYGITADAMGASILSSMEVVELPRGEVETPVYCDRFATEADGIITINRVKPHTSFHGPYESGLMKMCAIGLGKQRQAQAIHRLGVRGLREVMPQVAHQVLRHGKILLGIGIVENAYEETLRLQAIPAAQIPEREPALLELAREVLPKLPVDALDLLIVDEIGKNISGLGMDPNVIGRLRIPGEPEPLVPRIRCIIIRDLSAASHGNATGMGLADIMTHRLSVKIDRLSTYQNVLTTGFLERGKMPLIAEDDQQALEFARQALGMESLVNARIAHIRNTLHLEKLQVSPAVLDELRDHPRITLGEAVNAPFDVSGQLCGV